MSRSPRSACVRGTPFPSHPHPGSPPSSPPAPHLDAGAPSAAGLTWAAPGSQHLWAAPGQWISGGRTGGMGAAPERPPTGRECGQRQARLGPGSPVVRVAGHPAGAALQCSAVSVWAHGPGRRCACAHPCDPWSPPVEQCGAARVSSHACEPGPAPALADSAGASEGRLEAAWACLVLPRWQGGGPWLSRSVVRTGYTAGTQHACLPVSGAWW